MPIPQETTNGLISNSVDRQIEALQSLTELAKALDQATPEDQDVIILSAWIKLEAKNTAVKNEAKTLLDTIKLHVSKLSEPAQNRLKEFFEEGFTFDINRREQINVSERFGFLPSQLEDEIVLAFIKTNETHDAFLLSTLKELKSALPICPKKIKDAVNAIIKEKEASDNFAISQQATAVREYLNQPSVTSNGTFFNQAADESDETNQKHADNSQLSYN